MTTRREAKKQQKGELVVQSWEEKLQAAIMTGRQGLILGCLTAWAAQDPHNLLKPVGEERTFHFDPAAVAQEKTLQMMGDGDWPLYTRGGR